MKWKDTPQSWFGLPGKLLQYLIDNAKGLIGKNPDDPRDSNEKENSNGNKAS